MRRPGPIAAFLLAVLVSCTSAAQGARPGPDPSSVTPAANASVTRAAAARRAELEAAKRHLKHIVFVVKENRTFDTLFGRFPGADGATEGRTCKGRTVRLRRAQDELP